MRAWITRNGRRLGATALAVVAWLFADLPSVPTDPSDLRCDVTTAKVAPLKGTIGGRCYDGHQVVVSKGHGDVTPTA